LANRAYLLTVDDKSLTWSKDPEKEILAEGIKEIPVFWASLFRAGDRQLDQTRVTTVSWKWQTGAPMPKQGRHG